MSNESRWHGQRPRPKYSARGRLASRSSGILPVGTFVPLPKAPASALPTRQRLCRCKPATAPEAQAGGGALRDVDNSLAAVRVMAGLWLAYLVWI
jgi:hypothetical protein